MSKRGMTGEMYAKEKGLPVIIIIVAIVMLMGLMLILKMFVLLFPDELLHEFTIAERLLIILAYALASAVALAIIYSIVFASYALITGINVEINDNYVIDFNLVNYRLSRLCETQNCNERRRTTRLYLVMDVDEVTILLREQWTSVWFKGRAILPVELAIPGREFSKLYICRSTIKRIMKGAWRSRQCTFVELVFEFQEKNRIGRMSHEWEWPLMSIWDVTKLSAIYQGQPDIQFSDASAKYLITWDQLEQYGHTLTEAYQIIDLQPVIMRDEP